ncbi:cutinase family protein [Luteimicrobium subarcticum]|uniref:Cutinase n=1 Tax=Luteimicrobium subarcticum TaxID=620910 RepID=A0A2M8WS84_9MICO|nr:cutinase family protein [Luteimicrobium subarcticum]PJI93815.1 cutinase [Luteimicrobium subarcticum]
MRLTTRLRTISTRAAAAGTVLAAALAGQAVLATSASATVSSASCANVVQIVVRGSGEGAGSSPSGNVYKSGGFGKMYVVSSRVSSGTKKSVRTVGLNYPAAILPTTEAPLGYGQSEGIGRSRLAAELNRLAGACPGSRTVLIGYSQGAHVIGDVLSKDNPVKLSAAAKAKVAAVFLTGDPVRRYGESFNRGSGVGGGKLPNRAAGQLSGVASRLNSFCYKGDMFCDPNHPVAGTSGSDIHGSYGSTAIGKYGAAFILNILDRP